MLEVVTGFMSPSVTGTLPLLGSLKGEYELFQYVIHSVDKERISILIPAWLVNRYQLQDWDMVHLHAAFKIEDKFFSQGIIEEIADDVELQTTRYVLGFLPEPARSYDIYFEIRDGGYFVQTEIEEREMILESVKSSILLKQGLEIYLKHFVPYFSRISGINKEKFGLLQSFLFDDMNNRLIHNTKYLENLYHQLAADEGPDLFNLMDLDELRPVYESEINLDLLNTTFRDISHIPYVVAIKDLEESLYWNYNNLVLLYIRGLLARF